MIGTLVPTNVGAPARTSCWFGKHTQWAYCPADGKLYAYGGDGDWRLFDMGFAQQQSLNAVLSYDFSRGGQFAQETRQLGDPADGTCPYFHDGCTWVYRSVNDSFVAIPGYQPGPVNPARDPHGIMKVGVIHSFYRQTGRWIEGPPVRDAAGVFPWVGEHWGGAYDAKRDRIWINTAGSGEFGGMRWVDCKTWTFGKANLPRCPGLEPRISGIGYAIDTDHWPQHVNPVTDELLCADLYRGAIVAIKLDDDPAKLVPRLIAKVPAYRGDIVGEPLRTIEAGVAFSAKRQMVVVSYSHQSQYVVGGLGGVWAVDLATGESRNTQYPAPLTDRSWHQAVYDDSNDLLVLAGNIDDPDKNRFLTFAPDTAAPEPTDPEPTDPEPPDPEIPMATIYTVITSQLAALDEAYAVAGQPSVSTQLAQLPLLQSQVTTLNTKLQAIGVKLGELNAADAAEDAKRSEIQGIINA